MQEPVHLVSLKKTVIKECTKERKVMVHKAPREAEVHSWTLQCSLCCGAGAITGWCASVRNGDCVQNGKKSIHAYYPLQ